MSMTELRNTRVRRTLKKLSRFFKGSSGVIAPTYALMAVPLFAVAGLGLDGSRAMLAKYELQGALDGATLAVGSSETTNGDMKLRLQEFTRKNFQVAGATAPNVLLPVNTREKVRATATSELTSYFMHVVGVKTLTVSAESEVEKTDSGLAVSIVLDTTGSMSSSGKIEGAREATKALIDVLYGATPGITPPPNENLLISVVPYVTGVNIGDEVLALNKLNKKWVTKDNRKSYQTFHHKNTKKQRDDAWKGCVMEPPSLKKWYDDKTKVSTLVSDKKKHEFKPYAYPQDKGSSYNWGSNKDTGKIEWGYGPNGGCPTPITPLTDDYTKLQNAAAAIKANNGFGTLTDTGMAWGLRTLTPNAPFTEAAKKQDKKGVGIWTSKNWDKAVVIMTDGQTHMGWDGVGSSWYTGYGRTSDPHWKDLFGKNTDRKGGIKQSDQNLINLCKKAKDHGILVFTVTFGSGAKTGNIRKIFDDCATRADMAFHAPKNEDLKLQFGAIAKQLKSLRISK